ncbi:GNAT family N-acetyltransferase [Halobacteriales archaeon QS_3_64_16]|nr:MAG: GNAT family N-acetyltransferase [Halobacteriales archaeon QS_3_64_16]
MSDRSDGDDRIRQARPEDYETVVAFTENTWPGRGEDYIPRIYHDWIANDGEDQRTFVIEHQGTVAGICQAVALTEYEAWAQGMRVDPAHRGKGLSGPLNEALFDWAAARGAAVCRNMVFSWNAAGLGGARAAGFEPCTEFRWAHPEPNTETEPDLTVREDPDAAWSYWQRSDAREELRGLTLDSGESWALSALTRADLHRAAEEQRVFSVHDGGTRGLAYRVREYEREVRSSEDENDGNESESETNDTDDRDESNPETERWAEYGIGAWADVESARSLFRAIAADAAALDADRTRVLLPETPRHVSDAAVCRVETSAEPDFVLEIDLTDRMD